jgi:hypothetical protein
MVTRTRLTVTLYEYCPSHTRSNSPKQWAVSPSKTVYPCDKTRVIWGCLCFAKCCYTPAAPEAYNFIMCQHSLEVNDICLGEVYGTKVRGNKARGNHVRSFDMVRTCWRNVQSRILAILKIGTSYLQNNGTSVSKYTSSHRRRSVLPPTAVRNSDLITLEWAHDVSAILPLSSIKVSKLFRIFSVSYAQLILKTILLPVSIVTLLYLTTVAGHFSSARLKTSERSEQRLC